MKDDDIIKNLTPVGRWLNEHWILFGAFVILFFVVSLALLFNGMRFWATYDLKDYSEVARNSMALLALPAIWLALNRTRTATRQADIAERGQNVDRYQKSSSMLSDEKASVRIAGIYALSELAKADPDNHYFPVQNLLCTFIQDRSEEIVEANKEKMVTQGLDTDDWQDWEELPQCPKDIVRALEAISSLRNEDSIAREAEAKWKPDLAGIYLRKFGSRQYELNLKDAILNGAILKSAELRQANLESASLEQVDLRHARLFKTNLREAELREADLSNIRCFNSNFSEANFTEACLSKALFWRSNLKNAFFQNTNLQRASLTRTDAREARFDRADLQGAAVSKTDLQGAKLREANLKKCSLRLVKLQHADLYSADFQGAKLDETKLHNACLFGINYKDMLNAGADLAGAMLSIPIWRKDQWPEGLAPSDIKIDEYYDEEYFTFTPIEDVIEK